MALSVIQEGNSLVELAFFGLHCQEPDHSSFQSIWTQPASDQTCEECHKNDRLGRWSASRVIISIAFHWVMELQLKVAATHEYSTQRKLLENFCWFVLLGEVDEVMSSGSKEANFHLWHNDFNSVEFFWLLTWSIDIILLSCLNKMWFFVLFWGLDCSQWRYALPIFLVVPFCLPLSSPSWWSSIAGSDSHLDAPISWPLWFQKGYTNVFGLFLVYHILGYNVQEVYTYMVCHHIQTWVKLDCHCMLSIWAQWSLCVGWRFGVCVLFTNFWHEAACSACKWNCCLKHSS